MPLYDEAKANPDTPLVELNRFVEVDISLIIKAYEESMRQSETEEGVIVSGYGEVEKQRSMLVMFDSVTDNYGRSQNSNSVGIDIDLGAQLDNAINLPFEDCFPCDLRIQLGIDNLPHPAMFNIFENMMNSIEAFIQQMKNIMDPTNFYSDICALLDALRIVCPQDLLILLALLRFLLSHYITLSFQLDLDWTSILGLILLPILMLIHTLLQLAVNIGLGPANCLMSVLSVAFQIAQSSRDTILRAKDAFTTTTSSFADVGSEFDALLTGDKDSNSVSVDASASFSFGSDAEPIPIPPLGGYQLYQDKIGKLTASNSMLIAIKDVIDTLSGLLAKFTASLQALIDLLSGSLLLKMQFMAAIVDIIRLIGFISALIKALSDNSICKDPAQPLSSDDIQSIINTLNNSRYAATTTTSSTDSPSLISSTIGIDFDTSTGNLVLNNNITDQTKVVPSCINILSADDRDKINEWIQQLDSAS